MQRFTSGDSTDVYDIVTGDERWIYSYDPETKRQSAYINILAQPCYCSYLAPCDLYLFPKIKEKLQGKWFTDAKEAVVAYENAVEATPKYEWSVETSQMTSQTTLIASPSAAGRHMRVPTARDMDDAWWKSSRQDVAETVTGRFPSSCPAGGGWRRVE
ncbi:hypothetical protein EVAR_93605_1 [Eumeta japonica]|uniref:Uncharacterized protein n=1 Tax=Eumeta variegata TaxID=151549 RepID=A0A4C1TQH6_EUMVA|nr:hypothetical protein EVAR_93605_1 [Eumeta japonica]